MNDILDRLWHAFAARPQHAGPIAVHPQLLADAHSTIHQLAAQLDQVSRDLTRTQERLVDAQWHRDNEHTTAAIEIARLTGIVHAHRGEIDQLVRDENKRWTRQRHRARRERRQHRAAIDTYRRAVEGLPELITERHTTAEPRHRAVVAAQLLDIVCDRITDAARTYDATTAALVAVPDLPEGISA